LTDCFVRFLVLILSIEMVSNRDQKYINAFGQNLKNLRNSKGLSQEELAHRCGVPLSQVGRFERGVRSPTLSTILILARGLAVEPKTLLDFKFKI
jgi:transcriptional regulator with XRE-family HTH domain